MLLPTLRNHGGAPARWCMRIVKIGACVIAGLVAAFLLALTIYGSVLTSRTQADARQQVFLHAGPPDPKPQGVYQGSVAGRAVSWKGKRFHAERSAGINVFDEGGVVSEKYPFKTYVAPGIRDPEVSVFKIDYDLPENPFWLRRVLDEVVEVGPREYLGKIHVRWLFGSSIALGYFKLEQR